MTHFKTLLFFSASLFVLSYCGVNVYEPFDGVSSDEALIEAAQECLHDGDYNCAIGHYTKILDGPLRKQKLCTAYVAQAGFTVDALLNIITKSQSTMLGELARSLMPWSTTKGTAASNAFLSCSDFHEDNGGDTSTASLLRTIGVYVDCASRMSKTDQFIATSNSESTCNTPNTTTNNGVLTATDIGSTSGAPPGMCITDVLFCSEKLNSLSGNDLGDAGLDSIQGGLAEIPTAVLNSNTNSARDGLKDTIPAT